MHMQEYNGIAVRPTGSDLTAYPVTEAWMLQAAGDVAGFQSGHGRMHMRYLLHACGDNFRRSGLRLAVSLNQEAWTR